MILTFERLVCVRFPLQSKTIFTARGTWFVLLVVLCLLMLLDCHILIFYDFNKNGFFCTHEIGSYRKFFQGPWYFLDMTAYCGMPFLVICVCNVIIISRVAGSYQRRRAMQQKEAQRYTKDVQGITVMLLVVSIVFIILTLPLQTFFISVIIDFSFFGASPYIQALIWLLRYSVQIMAYSNSSVNFILYCVSGRQFRTAFLERIKQTFCLKMLS